MTNGCLSKIRTRFAQHESANPTPPDSLGGDAWEELRKSKEYRGYTRVKAKICVRDDAIVHHEELVLDQHAGYTPMRKFTAPLVGYDPAQDGTEQPEITVNSDHLLIHWKCRARLDKLGQCAGQIMTWADAPWIWREITYRLYTDGHYEIVFSGSFAPTHTGYIKDVGVWRQDQGDFGKFMYGTGDAVDAPPGPSSPSQTFSGQ